MAGFGARILNPDDIPKFINSPQTPYLTKAACCMGFTRHENPSVVEDQVVIVEGYLDVILLHQAGFTNTVSPMGTALTEDQLQQLKRLTRKIILALDADAAGEKATMRGLELARQAMDRSSEISFDARGLLKQEARLDADIRVTTLPDPEWTRMKWCSATRRNGKSILQAAHPVVLHVMQTLAANKDLSDPKEKSKIAEQVLPLIEDLPNPIERDAYRQQLARLLRVDVRSLITYSAGASSQRDRAAARRRPSRTADRDVMVKNAAQRTYTLETHILRLLIYRPESLQLINRKLLKAGLERLSSRDMEYSNHQVLLNVIQDSLEQDQLDIREYILDRQPAEIAGFAQELSAAGKLDEGTALKVNEDLYRSVISLRLIHVGEALEQITICSGRNPGGRGIPDQSGY